MFPSPKLTPPPEIKLIAGNAGSYSPTLTYNDEPLKTLGEGYFLMLIVKTPMGETVLSQTLTGSVEGTPIVFEFEPTDTIHVAPFRYSYSIDMYTGDGQSMYKTVERGVFHLQHPVGTYEDIETNEQNGGE